MDAIADNTQQEREQKERDLLKLKFRTAVMVSDNGQREQEALKGYYDFLDFLTPYWVRDPEDAELKRLKADIEEIISDELNHQAILSKWAEKIGGVREAKT